MVNSNFIRFKRTKGKMGTSFEIPFKGMMLPRKDKGGVLKHVQYIPGHESIWKEDHKGDEKPVPSVWMEDGFLDVHRNNENLLFILKNHKFYNVHFELVDEEVDDKKSLDKFELIEKAVEMVNIANVDELKANAVVLIGSHTINLSEVRLRKSLKQMAYDTPEDLIDKMGVGNYANRLAAALAVLRGVVKINPTQTAVTWPDGKVIVNVAAGQDPIEELGAYLSDNSEPVRVTLQTIGERIKRSYVKRQEPNLDDIVGSTDTGDNTDTGDSELEKAHAEYEEKLGKPVPNNKKNDLEWIQSKIDEPVEA